MLDQITPLVITYNEAENVRRTFDKLRWAQRILVVDSGSNDGTIDILGAYPQAQVVNRPFTDFASQCNFGVSLITTRWVLSLDADYELSDDLIMELQALAPPAAIAGYQARFIYRIHGRPLRGALYPPRTVLYRRDRAVYQNEGHGHRVSVDGAVLPFAAAIYHDDRKPLARWFASQQHYAGKEAEHLLGSDLSVLGRVDRIRLAAWPAPLLVFVYALFIKGCVLDGWPGWFYVLQRVVAESLIALEVIDRRLRRQR